MSNEHVCQHCGVIKIDGQFYWSNRKLNGDRYEAEPNEVYSKVCSVAKSCGRELPNCINQASQFDKTKTWLELDAELKVRLENS